MISTNKIAFFQAVRKRIYEQVADLFSGLLDFYTAFGLRASRDDPKAFTHWLKIGSDLGEEITLYRLVDNHDIQRKPSRASQYQLAKRGKITLS